MIYQYLRRQARAAVRIQLNFTKPPQASKPPSLNWRSVKTLFVPVAAPQGSVSSPIIISNSENTRPPLSFTPECEAGLEALNADADHEKVTIADALTTLEARCNGVDITLPFSRDLLSDKPVQGADAIHGLAGWSEGSAGGVGKGKKQANTAVWNKEAKKIVF
ncbi:hypothetical protein B0H14DRAFT_3158308 [Mycena olivaceomarginata]|nr:hypothetical protein B0H14DRAFT_3158308 [Mycena olivaceomarginata]